MLIFERQNSRKKKSVEQKVSHFSKKNPFSFSFIKMLSHLQKQFQQISTKFLSVPIQPSSTQASSIAAKKAAAKFQTPSVVPGIKKTTSSSQQINITDADVAATDDGSVATAMAKKQQSESISGSNASSPSLTAQQLQQPIQMDKTKSKAARIRSIQHAMSKERNVREAQEPFDFWTNVKTFNWKALIAFMICWTILGYYIIPWIKGWKGFKPPTVEEKDAEYNKGKQRLVEDTFRLRQRIEARKLRADRLESLGLSDQQQQQQEQKK